MLAGKFGDPGELRTALAGIHEGTGAADQCGISLDFDSYLAAETSADECYIRMEDWATKSILSVARCGKFSSDRMVREYANSVWYCAERCENCREVLPETLPAPEAVPKESKEM